MRKLKSREIALLVIVVFAILFSPFLLGCWVEHNYRQLIAFSNTQSNLRVTIQSYKKSWLDSRAKLLVEVLNFSRPLHFNVDQDIQYGPFIFRKNPAPSHFFEMAFIHSEINPAADTLQVMQSLDGKKTFMRLNDEVNFTGRHQIHFHSDGFKMDLEAVHKQIELDNLSGKIDVSPETRKLNGNISVENFSLTDPEYTMQLKGVDLSFDQKLTEKVLWLGNSKISLSQVNLLDPKGRTLMIVNLDTTGNQQEAAGGLNLSRQLKIEKLQIEDQTIGPIDLGFSAHDLDASALTRLFSIGSTAAADGSDFLQRFLTWLPLVTSSNSSIRLDNLNIDTSDGNLSLSGDVNWLNKSLAPDRGLKDVFHAADARASVRVSTVLAKDLIQMAADLSYLEERITNPQQAFLDSQQNVGIIEQQNDLGIAILIQANQLSKADGMKLLDLQKAKTSTDDYNAELKQLLADKRISQSTFNILSSQYEKIQFSSLTTDEQFAYLEDQFQEKFDEWLKDGYVTQDKDDYVASIAYQQGLLKMNGKPMQ